MARPKTRLNQTLVKLWRSLLIAAAEIQCSEPRGAGYGVDGVINVRQWVKVLPGDVIQLDSPAMFKRLMEKVLQPVSASACVVYFKDILVHAPTYTAVLNNLCTVFKQIAKANLRLNPAKCSLFCWQTTFLGHVVSERGVSTDPAKVEVVEK
ncbi:hypothetical protein AAFF_G00045200 [Aldrovandia affinis]|uniref:ribonuclease H n=1 Tax=Aldrovandia affinis TaxID=143900 RepID=A0AAD7S1Z7_9TELE|nr:hypothetical protein AAFF_G00045200 [Aldrovandia affinis]